MAPKSAARAETGLRRIPQITALYSVSGLYDMIALVEAVSVEQMDLAKSLPGTIIATVAAFPGGSEQIMIVGSKGTARMDGGNLRVSFMDGTEDVTQETGGSGGGSAFMAFSHEPHKAVISDFLDANAPSSDMYRGIARLYDYLAAAEAEDAPGTDNAIRTLDRVLGR